MYKKCKLCLSTEYIDINDSIEEKYPKKRWIDVKTLVNKIFGIDLNMTTSDTEKDILCSKCDENLDISNVMYETVIKAEEHFLEFGVQNDLEKPEVIEIIEEDPFHINVVKPSKTKPRKSNQNDTVTEDDEKISQFYSLTCTNCPTLTFPNFYKYKNHMKSQHNQRYTHVMCNNCNIKLYKRNALLEHISYHQNPDDFKCPQCKRQFKSLEQIQNHQKSIHGPKEMLKHECLECGKRFLQKMSLKTHMVVHLSREERIAKCNFICNECGNTFVSKYTFEKHFEQVHLSKNVYICDICAKVYKTKSQYEYHKTRAHTDQPQPKVQCEICENFFKNEICLKQHKRVMHEKNGMLHVCDICGKVSPTIKALQSHKRYVHINPRKFKCTICQKGFKGAIPLKEHMTIHLGGQLYSCMFCTKTFNSNANMYAHRKNMHPVELEKLKQQKYQENLIMKDLKN